MIPYQSFKQNVEHFALTCLYLAVYLESFFYYNRVTTAEGTGFWTPWRPTVPSSGVVASILFVSPGLDYPGVSLAEVCPTCVHIFGIKGRHALNSPVCILVSHSLNLTYVNPSSVWCMSKSPNFTL